MPPSRSPTSAPGELADEALARAPEHDRPAQLAQLAEAAVQLEVVLDGLAEADSRVHPDPLLVHPLRDRELDPLGQERLDVVDHVVVARVLLHRPRVPEHVHQRQLAAAIGAERGQLRLGPQRGDVVDDLRAGVERRLGHRALGGVDRDGRGRLAFPSQPLHHGQHPVQLLRSIHRLRARTGGLAADVEDVRALAGQLAPVRDRPLGVQELAPVREGVGGDVDDPHQPRHRGAGYVTATCRPSSPPSRRPRCRRTRCRPGGTGRSTSTTRRSPSCGY